jgi:hypothetical protein
VPSRLFAYALAPQHGPVIRTCLSHLSAEYRRWAQDQVRWRCAGGAACLGGWVWGRQGGRGDARVALHVTHLRRHCLAAPPRLTPPSPKHVHTRTRTRTRTAQVAALRNSNVVVMYASAYGNTAALAQAISRGLVKAGVAVNTVNLEVTPLDDVVAAIKRADGFTIGSPTLGGHMPTPVQVRAVARGWGGGGGATRTPCSIPDARLPHSGLCVLAHTRTHTHTHTHAHTHTHTHTHARARAPTPTRMPTRAHSWRWAPSCARAARASCPAACLAALAGRARPWMRWRASSRTAATALPLRPSRSSSSPPPRCAREGEGRLRGVRRAV